MHGVEGVAGKPVLGRLSLEMLHQQLDLAITELLGERDEQVRLTEVAIVFENFVLKDQMISEGVPG
jgi:hypothetical protein